MEIIYSKLELYHKKAIWQLKSFNFRNQSANGGILSFHGLTGESTRLDSLPTGRQAAFAGMTDRLIPPLADALLTFAKMLHIP